MTSLERSKYRDLFEDPNFRRWYENVARGSLATAQEWFRRTGLVRDKFGVTPRQIAKMRQGRASDFLLDVVGTLDREGRNGNYIANIVMPLKSWMSWNGIEVSRRIKIPRNLTPEVENEKTPTPEELKRILNAADPRAKVACSLMAFAGCRVEVLGSYAGEDGLEIRDLPELKISEKGRVEFEGVPTKITVRKTLNKARHNYFTFLGKEGLTTEMISHASLVVTMGCSVEEVCPRPMLAKVQKKLVDWNLPDPKGEPIEEVRRIGDEIGKRVIELARAGRSVSLP